MQIKSKEIKIIPIQDVRPNPKNANKHSNEQIDRLCEIIKYGGFRSPIIISNRSGLLIVGHARLEAAKKLGMAEIPAIFEDFDNDDAEYQHMVADNAIAEWSELDFSLINLEVPNLGPDFDIDLLGIENFEIEPAERQIGEKELDENIPTDHECPSCGYTW